MDYKEYLERMKAEVLEICNKYEIQTSIGGKTNDI
jgi:septum formation topological specificity factor MinE